MAHHLKEQQKKVRAFAHRQTNKSVCSNNRNLECAIVLIQKPPVEVALPQFRNKLLLALPLEVRVRLLLHLQPMELVSGETLHESGGPVLHVYFPINAVVSLICEMSDGTSTEIAMVGNEGLIGVSAFMGGGSTPSRAVVLRGGAAYRIPAKRIADEFGKHSDMLCLVLRYTQSLISQMAQTAVCNRHHAIDQQLCRFLLLFLDRIAHTRLNITQDVIANMLGVRREGISAAAGKLQKQGVIDYHRGCMQVLDRDQLELNCCECYSIVKAEYARLLNEPSIA